MFMEIETLSNKEKTKRVNFIKFIIKKRANKACETAIELFKERRA